MTLTADDLVRRLRDHLLWEIGQLRDLDTGYALDVLTMVALGLAIEALFFARFLEGN